MGFIPGYAPRSAPYNGPFDAVAALITAAGAAGIEGLWIDAGFAKNQSIELTGVMSTVGLELFGSNAPSMPPNEYLITVGGSATATDVLDITFSNENLPGGSHTVAYTVPASPSIDGVAAGIAAAINADATLQALGFSAAAVSAVITLSYPSFPPGSPAPTPSSPGPSNATTLAFNVNGGSETLTAAVGTNGTQIGSTIAALGITALTVNVRWLTARLVTLTGSTPNVSVNWHGVG